MSAHVAEHLPSAKDLKERIAMAEAEEASRIAKKLAAAEAEKRALIEELAKPVAMPDEEAIRRAVLIIERAVSNGHTAVEVHRFPSKLCTDRGRSINQQESNWGTTLIGVPKQIYNLWEQYFRPRGYKLTAEIVSFPDGVPGDVSMTLRWD